MSTAEKPTEPDLVACEICLKEIPVSEAKNEEVVDYVTHYFGLECYTVWKHQGEKE